MGDLVQGSRGGGGGELSGKVNIVDSTSGVYSAFSSFRCWL